MIFGSVCSGIEAASVAWSPLGWKVAWFAEIEKFPSAVLAHHYPNTPNLGDITRLHEKEDYKRKPIDLLVGGTPCQSFSVAGLRKGMGDPRGNLALVFLQIADFARPRWIVWENVPGVLSSNRGRDFGAFLGALGELGYGWSYRVMDAQFFGVPQRRRRVFVVGYLGDWRRAAAVLFEPDGLRRNPASSGKARTGVAALTATGVETCGADDNQAQAGHLIAHTLKGGGGLGTDFDLDGGPIVINGRQDPITSKTAQPLDTDPCTQVVAFTQNQAGDVLASRNAPSMGTNQNATGRNTPKVVAFTIHGTDKTAKVASPTDIAGAIRTKPPGSIENSSTTVAMSGMIVRRLTPRECCRLQGFPDDYTLIPWRGHPAAECPDGPRYKALGNSMAVPVMSWIGRRIQAVENLKL